MEDAGDRAVPFVDPRSTGKSIDFEDITMTLFKHVAAGALIVALGGPAAAATDALVCQTWNPAKTGRAVTHCVTWTRQAASRMRAAGCNPKTMTDAQMRVRCAELMAEAERDARGAAGS